jgi:hypothetical protein
MLTVAQAGATGVNLHGGADGLYTPTAGSTSEGYTARPIYYGMLLLQELLGSTLLRTNVDGTGKNIAAYAARTDRAFQVVLLNREPESMTYQIVLPKSHSDKLGTVWRLEAPSVASTRGVTLAQAAVTPHGEFHPTAHEVLRVRKNRTALRLAPYSAALVTIPLEERRM